MSRKTKRKKNRRNPHAKELHKNRFRLRVKPNKKKQYKRKPKHPITKEE